MATETIDVPCKVATENVKVYKDECLYCFRTSESPGGIYICLNRFYGFCENHLERYVQKTTHLYFLNFCRKRIKKHLETENAEKITKLAVGVEGGFDLNSEIDFEDTFFYVQYPQLNNKISLSDPLLSSRVLEACNAIVSHDGAFRTQQLQSGINNWDGSVRSETKHKILAQIENPPKIAPNECGKCQDPRCDLTKNLWLNLSDGSIKCGRMQYISAGVVTEGRNHARDHYENTGKQFPLVVKLGTITSAGDADVFSYDEDDSVIDPYLIQHLKHFGIDVTSIEKTEKSTMELELDMNQKWEFMALTEEGTNLENVYGPGYTGLINLGSSCYINSTIQSLCLVPGFLTAYSDNYDRIRDSVPFDCFNENLFAQLSKLIHCLESGAFSQKPSENEVEALRETALNGIKPRQLRYIVGLGHPEFSTAKQQDAEEYIRYLFGKIDEESKRMDEPSPVDAFRFKIETRFQDSDSAKVRYTVRQEVLLSLRLPLETAINRDVQSQKEGVRPVIPLSACMQTFGADQAMNDFRSPLTGQLTGAVQRQRFASFPDYLLVQVQKFGIADDFTPKKLEVDMDIPEELDLEYLRGTGLQSGEELLPEQGNDNADDSVSPVDAQSVEQLTVLGFTEYEAGYGLRQNNGDVAASAEWLFNNTVPPPDSASKRKRGRNDQKEKIDQLTVLGFSENQARYALARNAADVAVSAEWLFNNADTVPAGQIETAEEEEMSTTAVENEDDNIAVKDGSGKYRLIGFISHMGANCHCGHYVAHLRKKGRWVLFNDEKVAFSKKPPIGYGYIYLYERVGA